MTEEYAKVQPKKEVVRINLPPKPATAPTIKIPFPVPAPVIYGPPVYTTLNDAVCEYVRQNEEKLRQAYGLQYIVFSHPSESYQLDKISVVGHHDEKGVLQNNVDERYAPAHPHTHIIVKTIDEILYPECFSKIQEGAA